MKVFVLLAVHSCIVIMEIPSDIITCDTTKQKSVYIHQLVLGIALRMASTACSLMVMMTFEIQCTT